MDKSAAKERVAKLRDLINEYRYQYHVLDRLEISEDALDSLKKELFDLEAQYPDLVTPDSPTQRVAGQPHFIQFDDLAQLLQPAGEQQAARISFGRADFGVPADDDFLFGAREGDVQQAQVFGVFAVGIGECAQLPGAGPGVLGRDAPAGRLYFEQDAERRVKVNRAPASAVVVGRIRDDDERKFKPFGFVDSHELHRAAA